MYRVDIAVYNVDEEGNEERLFRASSAAEMAINAFRAAGEIALELVIPLDPQVDPEEAHQESAQEGFEGGSL